MPEQSSKYNPLVVIFAVVVVLACIGIVIYLVSSATGGGGGGGGGGNGSIPCEEPCQHGKCVSGACVCESGYTGPLCKDVVDTSACSVSCGDNGVCNGTTGMCDCTQGWMGSTCTEKREYTPTTDQIWAIEYNTGSGSNVNIPYQNVNGTFVKISTNRQVRFVGSGPDGSNDKDVWGVEKEAGQINYWSGTEWTRAGNKNDQELHMSIITVNCIGTAYGVSSSGYLYRRTTGDARFVSKNILVTGQDPLNAKIKWVSSQNDENVWGIMSNGLVYRTNSTFVWTPYTPSDKQLEWENLSVGCDGEVWGVSPSGMLGRISTSDTLKWFPDAPIMYMVKSCKNAIWGLGPMKENAQGDFKKQNTKLWVCKKPCSSGKDFFEVPLPTGVSGFGQIG